MISPIQNFYYQGDGYAAPVYLFRLETNFNSFRIDVPSAQEITKNLPIEGKALSLVICCSGAPGDSLKANVLDMAQIADGTGTLIPIEAKADLANWTWPWTILGGNVTESRGPIHISGNYATLGLQMNLNPATDVLIGYRWT